jgi:hypothetical protein
MSSSTKNWSESAASPFFTLSQAKLAEVLQASMPMDDLTPDQQLYAKALLLHIASDSVNTMHEDARLGGQLAARMLSPAYSMARVGQYEDMLYALIEKGDVEAVKSTTKRQKITSTAHPNFSRSRALVQKSAELASELSSFTRQEQAALETQGELPAGRAARVNEMLSEMKALIEPRQKRTRRDELQETALDIIPVAMKAASQQVEIFKKRKSLLGGDPANNPISIEETEREVDGRTRKVKVISSSGETKPMEFSSLKQLESVAALFPEYNNWFLDGDGKRTCHVYDAELAVPAVKRATYKEYLELLKKLPDKLGDFDTVNWRRKLARTIDVLKEVEALAAVRMDAFNQLHEAHKAYNEDTQDIELRAAYRDALELAEQASVNYLNKLHSTTSIEGKTVIQLLKADDANPLRSQLAEQLESAYAGRASMQKPHKEAAEDLYMKLTAYGNYAVHMQRRENAVQYREVFEFLVQNNLEIKKLLAKSLNIEEAEILARLEDPETFSRAVEVLSVSAMDANDPLGVRESVFASYKRVANKLEKVIKKTGDTSVIDTKALVMKPLQDREFLALDALGCYNMSRLYPEAFEGGFVIAEFGQPDIDVLREGTQDDIRDEVVRLARTDMLLQAMFSHAMGAQDAAIIPLHEDPATMKYAPDAQAALRKPPLMDYLLKWAGADTPEGAQKNARRYIDTSGEPQLLTAYQNLQRFGCTDEELVKHGHDIDALKNTYVLEGPDDMEACSDNNKRSSTMGSEEAEQSIREKAIKASLHSVPIGDAKYVILKPKYLGQGGAMARSTKVPLDAQQATWQGEQLSSLTPKSIAYMAYNNTLGRLYLSQEAAHGGKPSDKLSELASERPYHIGNMLGFPGSGVTSGERELMDATINARITSTRDDPRYNTFLQKYGEPAPNYSARPNAKGNRPETFNSGRAIGIAAKEAGIWSNVIGISEMFDFGKKGSGKGEITEASAADIRRWMKKDFYIQHMLTAGALVANFVNLEEKWARGDIQYQEDAGGITLTKKNATVSLETLKAAYDSPKTKEYKDPKTGVVFDAGDLVMAHLTDQFHKLKKGLHAVYPGKKDLIDLFDKSHQPAILAYKGLYDEVLKRLRETKKVRKSLADKTSEEYTDTDRRMLKDRELLEGTYYVMFESGEGIFPIPSLLEQGLYSKAQQPDAAVSIN